MASALQQYRQLADTTALQITGSYQSWTNFLTTAARIYKYPYHEQLMLRLAALLPEFDVVMSMFGAGNITGPQLMAEIGDVRRFTHKGALVAFAGVDAPPYQSGMFDSKTRHVSKRGSPHLRKTLFTVCSVILQHSNTNDPVYLFMDKKRSEGKHYYVFMIAGAAKFLRIYYARVKEALLAQETEDTSAA